MRHVLLVMGILTAAVIGLSQGPNVESADSIAVISGSAVTCPYSGYTATPCSVADPGDCTSGNLLLATYVGGTNKSHRDTGETQAAGTCAGNSSCDTSPNTTKLTTDGCAG